MLPARNVAVPKRASHGTQGFRSRGKETATRRKYATVSRQKRRALYVSVHAKLRDVPTLSANPRCRVSPGIAHFLPRVIKRKIIRFLRATRIEVRTIPVENVQNSRTAKIYIAPLPLG